MSTHSRPDVGGEGTDERLAIGDHAPKSSEGRVHHFLHTLKIAVVPVSRAPPFITEIATREGAVHHRRGPDPAIRHREGVNDSVPNVGSDRSVAAELQRGVVDRREPGEGQRGEHEPEVAQGDVVEA